MQELTDKDLEVIHQHLFSNDTLSAIREYRRYTGADLFKAKSFIEDKIKELREKFPNRFGQKSSASESSENSQGAPLYMDIIQGDRLRQSMALTREIEKTVYGLNYGVTLDVKAVKLCSDEFSIPQLMRFLYPQSAPDMAFVHPSSAEEFIQGLEEGLLYEGDQGSGPQFTDERRLRMKNELIPKYLEFLENLIPFDQSSFYSYRDSRGLPGDDVFWFFAAIIHNKTTRHCAVVTAMASD